MLSGLTPQKEKNGCMCFDNWEGMVQANVGQKLVNRNIFTSFLLSDYELIHATFSQYDAT